MKKKIKNALKRFLKPAVDRIYNYSIDANKAKKIINNISIRSEINLLELAHNNMGIMKYENTNVSGEVFFLKNVLPSLIQKNKDLVIFDVGANIGNYSKELCSAFKKAAVHSFEPNPKTFQILINNTKDISLITPVCLGFGSTKQTSEIFTYSTDAVSEHATVLKQVITDLHKAGDVQTFLIDISTIDSYCETNKIKSINFLKIDTEGYELEVLKGAARMISKGLIDVIQFEFNEMNVISKVFLKDFYEILNKYDLFRLDTNRLIPLRDYDSINEIFRFQNIVAIKPELNFNNIQI